MTLSQWGRRAAAVTFAAVAALALGSAAAPRASAQTPDQKKAEQQRMTSQAQSLKAQLGFSDAQVKTFQTKQSAIVKQYQPRIEAIQKKHGIKTGVRPTPEQQKKAMPEMQPLAMEMIKKVEKALMDTATPAQRTKMKSMMAGAPRPGGGGAPAPRPGG